MGDAPAPRLVARFRWWLWLGAVVVVALGLFITSRVLDAARAAERRDRLRAVIPELEEAVAKHLECLLPPPREGAPWPYQDWAAGADLRELGRTCAVELQRVAEALRERVDLDDTDALDELDALERRAGTVIYRDNHAAVADACAEVVGIRESVDTLRRRARLAPGPPLACDATIPEVDVPHLDRDDYHHLFDSLPLAEPWVRSEGDALYVGGHYQRIVAGGPKAEYGIARNVGGTWTRVVLDLAIERMRWQDDGPWAVVRQLGKKKPLRVMVHRDGAWSPGVELPPRITDIAAMRSTGEGRVLVGWRSDDAVVVIRLDADASRVLETIELGMKTTRIPDLAVTTAGDVTAIWELVDGDADVIHLAAGATTPRRTTEVATGTVRDLCLDGRDVFLRFGARLLHSADGGTTLTEIPDFGSLAWHHLACGPGWLAGLELTGASYVVCRPGGCRRTALTTRDYQRFALSRAGDDVRILAQTFDVALVWEDPAAAGAPRMHGVWSVDDQHTLVQLDGTWFHTSSASLGAY